MDELFAWRSTPPGHHDQQVLAEYIYIVDGIELQSRTVVLEGGRPYSVDGLPNIELQTEHGEVYLQPRSVYADPLRGGNTVLVLCDVFVPPQFGSADLRPHPHESNTRAMCAEVMGAVAAAQPSFSMEQEYTVLDPFTGLPPGVFNASIPIYTPGGHGADSGHQDMSHNSSYESGPAWSSPPGAATLAASLSALPGGPAAAARLLLQAHAQPPQPPSGSPAARRAGQLAELHMRACVKAGLCYAGSSLPGGAGGRWSYKIGPCSSGVVMGDQVNVSRFLLSRLGERLDLGVSFDSGGSARGGGRGPLCDFPPSPPGGANTLSCSLEFSTAAIRGADGGDAVGELQRMLSNLQACHAKHAPGYSSPPPPFSVAVGDPRASIVIPSSTLAARKGPFLDRRPSGDCDPYLVAALTAAGALGAPLPDSAARAAAALTARKGAAAAAASAAAPPPSPAWYEAAAQLLLERTNPHASIGDVCAALSAAVAAGCLPLCAVRPSLSRGPVDSGSLGSGCSGSYDDSDSGGFSGSQEDECSEDMLVSEIRRMDRKRARRTHKAAAGLGSDKDGCSNDDDDFDLASDFEDSEEEYEGEEDDSACSAMASASGSPSCDGPLACAWRADVEMAAS